MSLLRAVPGRRLYALLLLFLFGLVLPPHLSLLSRANARNLQDSLGVEVEERSELMATCLLSGACQAYIEANERLLQSDIIGGVAMNPNSTLVDIQPDCVQVTQPLLADVSCLNSLIGGTAYKDHLISWRPQQMLDLIHYAAAEVSNHLLWHEYFPGKIADIAPQSEVPSEFEYVDPDELLGINLTVTGPIPDSYMLVYYREDMLRGQGIDHFPDTWEELINVVSTKLRRQPDPNEPEALPKAYLLDLDGDGVQDWPVCLSTGYMCKGGYILSAIAASYMITEGLSQGFHFNPNTLPLETRLTNNPAFSEALRVLYSLAALGPDSRGTGGLHCPLINKLFQNGTCAITIDFDYSPFVSNEHEWNPNVSGNLRAAPLPGSTHVWDMQTQPANSYKWEGDPIENGLTECSLEVCPLAVSSSSGLLVNQPTFSSRSLLRKVLANSLPTSITWEEILYAQIRTFTWDNLTLDAASKVIDEVVEVQDKWYEGKRAAIDYFLDNSTSGYSSTGGGDWKLNVSSIYIPSGLEPTDAEEVMTAVWTSMQCKNQVEDFMVVNPWGVRAALHAAADKTTLLAMSRAFDRADPESTPNTSAPNTSAPGTSAPNTSATVTSRKLLMLSNEEIEEMENTTQEILNFLERSVAYAYKTISIFLDGMYEGTSVIQKITLDKKIQMMYQDSINAPRDAAPGPPPRLDIINLSQPLSSSSAVDAKTIIIASVCLVVGVLLIALVFIMYWRFWRRTNAYNKKNEPPGASPNTTLVVTDIQSSTDLWEALRSEVMDEALQLHNECIRTTLLCHEGYESCTEGDSFIIAFHTARAAVSFSTDAQVSLMHLNWPEALLHNKNAEVVWLWQPSPNAGGLDSPFKGGPPVQNAGLSPEASLLTTIQSDRGFGGSNLSAELLVPKESHEESVDGRLVTLNSWEFNIVDAPQNAISSLSRTFSGGRHVQDPPVDNVAPRRISSGFLSASRLGAVPSKSLSANFHSSWNDIPQSDGVRRQSKDPRWMKKGQSTSATHLNVDDDEEGSSSFGQSIKKAIVKSLHRAPTTTLSASQSGTIDEHNPLRGETNPRQVSTAIHTPRGTQLLMDPPSHTDQTDKGISLYHALALGWRRVTEAEATQITNKERWKGQAPSVEMAFRGLRVRIGIHSGGLRLVDISANGTSGRVGYRGYALAMAKAVEASAHGGQVLLSQETFAQLDVPSWRSKPLVLFTGDHIVKDVVAAQTTDKKTSYSNNVYVPGSPKPPTGGQQATPPALGGLALPPPISTSWPTTGYSLGSLLPNSAVKRESRLRKTSAPDPQPTVVVDKREFNRRSSPEWAITSPYSSGQGNCVNLVSPKTPEKLPNVVDMSEASRALMQVGVTTEDSNTQVSLYVALIPSLLCRLAFLPPVPRTPIQLSPGTLEAPIGQAAIVFMTVAGSKTLMAFDSELMKESIALAQLCVTKELKQKSTLQYPAFMAEMSDEGLFLAAFSRSLDAISWALACMEGMKRLPWRTKLLAHEQFEAITASELTADGQVVDRLIMRGLRLKAGVAWGPVHHNICVTTGRMAYRGRVMNRSARVMAMASSAEVLCTGAAYTQVLNSQRLRGHYKGCALCGNIRATQKGVFDLKGIRDPVTIYRCLKDWPTRLGSDSYPAVLGPIAIPIRSPTHLSQPDVGEIGVYESSGNLDRKTSSTSNKCLHHHECPHELQGSRQSLESSKQSQKISAFAPPGDPSMDEFNLHVMVMRANYEESDPAYPYAPNSEYSEGTQSPGAKAVALAPSVGSPRLPTLGLDVSGRHESRSGKLRLDVSGKHESQSGKLRLDGSGRHESRSGTYDHLISPELSLPPALNPGECSTQHFMGRTAGLPMLASSHSVGCVHKKSFLLPLGAKELDGGPGGSSGVARVANAKSSLGLDASLGPPRREDCVAEQMCSHQTFTLTEGAHDDLIEGTHDGGNSSEDEAQSEELFHSGGIRGETAGGRDSRKSPRNRLLNNLLPTMSRVISKRFGKGDGGNEEPVRGRSNNKKEGSSNIGRKWSSTSSAAAAVPAAEGYDQQKRLDMSNGSSSKI